MNAHEAQLAVVHRVQDVLLSLLDEEEEVAPEELDGLLDAAALVVEGLGLRVTEVAEDKITAELGWETAEE